MLLVGEGKILRGCPGGRHWKRAMGLAKDEKHNSKLKPVTLSTSYSLKAFSHALPEHSLLIETAGPDTREYREK